MSADRGRSRADRRRPARDRARRPHARARRTPSSTPPTRRLLGGGGVDGAIHRAGGPADPRGVPRASATRRGPCRPGEAVDHHRRAPARPPRDPHRGPVWQRRRRGRARRRSPRCYRNSLALAAEHGLASVAFPSISTGAYGYPVDGGGAPSPCAPSRDVLRGGLASVRARALRALPRGRSRRPTARALGARCPTERARAPASLPDLAPRGRPATPRSRRPSPPRSRSCRSASAARGPGWRGASGMTSCSRWMPSRSVTSKMRWISRMRHRLEHAPPRLPAGCERRTVAASTRDRVDAMADAAARRRRRRDGRGARARGRARAGRGAGRRARARAAVARRRLPRARGRPGQPRARGAAAAPGGGVRPRRSTTLPAGRHARGPRPRCSPRAAAPSPARRAARARGRSAPAAAPPTAAPPSTSRSGAARRPSPTAPHVYLREDDGARARRSPTATCSREAAAVAGGLRERGVAPRRHRGPDAAHRPRLPAPPSRASCIAGGVPVPIYPPARLDRLEEYAQRQSAILADAGVRAAGHRSPRARPVAALLRPRCPRCATW